MFRANANGNKYRCRAQTVDGIKDALANWAMASVWSARHMRREFSCRVQMCRSGSVYGLTEKRGEARYLDNSLAEIGGQPMDSGRERGGGSLS